MSDAASARAHAWTVRALVVPAVNALGVAGLLAQATELMRSRLSQGPRLAEPIRLRA
jgi:hypothetical protein